jgi:transposase-like protein
MLSDETVRRWVNHFGPKIAAYLRKRRPKLFANAARSRILSGVCACETDLSG